MKTPIKLLLLLTLASLALFAAAACGDDDDTNGDENGDATATATANVGNGNGGNGGAAATVGDLDIMSPFSRGTLDRGAVFFTVVNSGDVADALIAADTDIAGSVEIHETVMEDGQAMMKPIAKIDVPAGGEATLEPGGLHVMLLDLPDPLEVGQVIPVTLTFENAGDVTLDVEVISYSATDPMEGDTGMDDRGMESPSAGM